MSKVVQRGAVAPSMNITPLIDVVFLLIIFFMLVNNIVSEETVDMVLPELEDPQTRELGDVDRIVINVAPEPFTRQGRAEFPLSHTGTASYIKIGTGSNSRFEITDIPGITEKLKQVKAQRPEVEALLRADGAIYYDVMEPVMDALSTAGIETVNLVAYMPSD
ncbi:ExbD/TolR family protein [Algisphaera agarilytica]|uniref:Biopolymer transport protein ExbD n=1 Tax=Algisphaera agarilytica TaxID=1385975 RepID=A0A7X0H792_9BACT|nr:biopolymer transporter ExbD [Algisphaera agarilytica]MBB6430568.1 biopolymer transport protein ExbD [Algisphaera agarilytica]